MTEEIKLWLGRLETRSLAFRTYIEMGAPKNVVQAAAENIQEAVHRIQALHIESEPKD